MRSSVASSIDCFASAEKDRADRMIDSPRPCHRQPCMVAAVVGLRSCPAHFRQAVAGTFAPVAPVRALRPVRAFDERHQLAFDLVAA